MRQLIRSLAILLFAAALTGCGSDPSGPSTGGTDDPPPDDVLHLDPGHIGVVLDTRGISHKGYQPTEAQISFPSYPERNAVLPVDPFTNLAILTLDNDDLSAEEKAAFDAGLAATIVIVGESHAELARLDHPSLVLDESNQPLVMQTALPGVEPVLSLRPDLPYLIQPEGGEGFLSLTNCSDCYREVEYVFDDPNEQHFFTEAGAPGSGIYNVAVHHLDYPEREHWFMEGGIDGFLGIRGTAAGGPEDFALEPEGDGYVRIRHVDSGLYLYGTTGGIELNDSGDRYRIISDAIVWTIDDLGTQFNQPIMPPARLDFAYSGRLSNCSNAVLEESVGQTESRTTTTTIATTEGFELFAENTASHEVTYTMEIAASIGFELGVFGESLDVAYSEEETWAQAFTTSRTTSSENTWSRETSRTIEVSRVRTVTVPPFNVVDVDDAVKSMRNVRIPFTQVLRVRGMDRRNSTPISGAEIVTQIQFNHATGLVKEIGADFAVLTLRGMTEVDQILNASTLVRDVENGCE